MVTSWCALLKARDLPVCQSTMIGYLMVCPVEARDLSAIYVCCIWLPRETCLPVCYVRLPHGVLCLKLETYLSACLLLLVTSWCALLKLETCLPVSYVWLPHGVLKTCLPVCYVWLPHGVPCLKLETCLPVSDVCLRLSPITLFG